MKTSWGHPYSNPRDHPFKLFHSLNYKVHDIQKRGLEISPKRENQTKALQFRVITEGVFREEFVFGWRPLTHEVANILPSVRSSFLVWEKSTGLPKHWKIVIPIMRSWYDLLLAQFYGVENQSTLFYNWLWFGSF